MFTYEDFKSCSGYIGNSHCMSKCASFSCNSFLQLSIRIKFGFLIIKNLHAFVNLYAIATCSDFIAFVIVYVVFPKASRVYFVNQHLPCTYFVVVIRSHFQNNVNTLCVITSAGQAAFCLD